MFSYNVYYLDYKSLEKFETLFKEEFGPLFKHYKDIKDYLDKLPENYLGKI